MVAPLEAPEVGAGVGPPEGVPAGFAAATLPLLPWGPGAKGPGAMGPEAEGAGAGAGAGAPAPVSFASWAAKESERGVCVCVTGLRAWTRIAAAAPSKQGGAGQTLAAAATEIHLDAEKTALTSCWR